MAAHGAQPIGSQPPQGGPFRRFVQSLTRAGIAACSGAALLVACESMLARYVDSDLSFDWTSEVVIFLLIWAMFLSASELAGRGGHIRVDLAMRLLPQAARRWFALFAAVLGIVVAAMLVWSGALVVMGSVEWDERTTSSLQLPLWVYYLSLPTGAVLLFLRLGWRCADLLRDRHRDDEQG